MTYSGTIDLSSSDDKLVDIPITNGVCVTAMHIYADRPGCYIKDFNTNSDIYAQIGDIGDGRWYLWAD